MTTDDPDAHAALPDEVLDAIGAAADRADDLAAANRQLHFEIDETSARLRVEVRDLHGASIRAISPAGALDVIGGGAPIPPVDTSTRPPMIRA
jgi:hypothetical protein